MIWLVKFFYYLSILAAVITFLGGIYYGVPLLFSEKAVWIKAVSGIIWLLVLIATIHTARDGKRIANVIILTDAKQLAVKKRRDSLLYVAAFLFPAKDRDSEIGNMLEIYEKDKKRFGQKRALKLLAFDVIKSIYPLVKRAIGLIVRTVLRTLGLYKIYKSFWG